MNEIQKSLEKFRDMEISKDELNKVMQGDKTIDQVEVCAEHIINLLTRYSLKLIDDAYTPDWVNTIWFSEWYFYNEDQCDSIASVMNELEELDEGLNELTQEKIDTFIYVLEHNQEL